MFDLDDPKISNLADVITNKTSKKILDFLSENEASESEIANKLSLPANTVNYNIKKLLEAGLVEKTRDFLWSVKGKKIYKYKLANKKIIISPKFSRVFANTKQILATLGISAIATYALRAYYDNNLIETSKRLTQEYSLADAGSALEVSSVAASQVSHIPEIWPWFLAGAVFALVIYFLIGKVLRK